MREELREPRNYFAILSAIANKKTKLSEIISVTGLEKSMVSSYLTNLQDLGFVRREIPVTEKYAQRSKKGHYVIDDPFLVFWFDYVFPNTDRIERGETTSIFHLLKQKELERLSGIYESQIVNIFLESLPEKLSFPVIGRWWNSETEIDFVALNEKENRICFAESKWTNEKIDMRVLEKLQESASKVGWGNKKAKTFFALFSKNGFTPGVLRIAHEKGNIFLFQQDKYL